VIHWRQSHVGDDGRVYVLLNFVEQAGVVPGRCTRVEWVIPAPHHIIKRTRSQIRKSQSLHDSGPDSYVTEAVHKRHDAIHPPCAEHQAAVRAALIGAIGALPTHVDLRRLKAFQIHPVPAQTRIVTNRDQEEVTRLCSTHSRACILDGADILRMCMKKTDYA
jgi:hypothetical protein